MGRVFGSELLLRSECILSMLYFNFDSQLNDVKNNLMPILQFPPTFFDLTHSMIQILRPHLTW